jgi:S-adenosylmethionine:tRNA ribosyltransferase-isomerase
VSETLSKDTALAELDDFDYELPPESIAQQPAARRDQARLLVMDRAGGDVGGAPLSHRRVCDLPGLLHPDDLVVMNATRVLPARLVGRKPTGGAVDALLLGEAAEDSGRFRALVRSSGRLRVGQKFLFSNGTSRTTSHPSHGATRHGATLEKPAQTLEAELVELRERGEVELQFERRASPYSIGVAPLPPYIRRPGAPVEESPLARPHESPDLATDLERYQTVFARVPGAIAAPTAGLHFTPELLRALGAAGIRTAEVVLHVGAGTFRPLSSEDLASGRLHPEAYELPPATAHAIAETRDRGGRVVAIGTTTTRVLESCADSREKRAGVRAGAGETDLFLRPASPFRVVDALLTNFHLPRSSLLLLVAAFAGRESILAAYREAIASGYRFYSYGDAMLIR